MELGLAASTVNTVKERHTQYNAQLATMLAEIETAPREEIAMMLLTLQTQLQASYQATSMASQLSLVNYLR
jgi:flagellin-like hook-associated protein FlgL